MLEFEQRFLISICKLCSRQINRYGRTEEVERKFVTNAGDPRRVVCGNCGYSTLTKNIQLIKQKQEEK